MGSEPSKSSYETFLRDLKERIQNAQVRAALAVNRELTLLYWQIGREILHRQQQQGWGAKVVNRLAADLRKAFPDIKGFSARNLLYMRAFAEAYPDEQIVQQVVALIPWGHNVRILDAVKTLEERMWYIRQTIQYGWSRNILTHQIDSQLYRRQGNAITNRNALRRRVAASRSPLKLSKRWRQRKQSSLLYSVRKLVVNKGVWGTSPHAGDKKQTSAPAPRSNPGKDCCIC